MVCDATRFHIVLEGSMLVGYRKSQVPSSGTTQCFLENNLSVETTLPSNWLL